MEYLGVILGVVIGAVVAFFCMSYYRQGIKDGRALKDERPLEKIVEKPMKPSVMKNDLMGFLGSNGDKENE